MIESGTKILVLAWGTGAVTVLAAGLTWMASIGAVLEIWATFSRAVMVGSWITLAGARVAWAIIAAINEARVRQYIEAVNTTEDLPRNFRYPDN